MRECITAHSRIQICSGSDFCRNSIIDEDFIVREMLSSAQSAELPQSASGIIEEPSSKHRFFSASVSFCPNACSRPQIADFGVIGASIICRTDHPCTNCNACTDACRESAIDMSSGNPVIITGKCVHCGSCAAVCPSGTLTVSKKGFRVLIGGRMGRHPQFGEELPGIYNSENVIRIFKECYSLYNNLFTTGMRFSEMILRYPEQIPSELKEKLAENEEIRNRKLPKDMA